MIEFKKTPKQIEAVDLLGGSALHVLLEGGSRSGKSVIICRQIILRALKCFSRHVVFRKHFNHVKQSIWMDTLPFVMDSCFPGLSEKCEWNKTDWYVKFPKTESELWIGGLDDKERTEKILGKEFSTEWFNECSEMDFQSVSIAHTRLSQKNELVKRFFYDCNPPKQTHWTHKLFHEGKHPVTDQPVASEKFESLLINPQDNLKNIDPNYIKDVLETLPPLLRDRFLLGLYGSDNTDIIRAEWIYPSESIGPIAAKFTFIDPAFTEEAKATDTSCESAIVTLGIDFNGTVHDLEVQSGFWSYGELKAKAVATHKRHSDVAERYFAVEDVAAQKWLSEDLEKDGIVCFKIKPDGDKIRRTIGITDLLEQGRCRVNNKKLRDQLLGFPGEKLKDLVDAYVGCLQMVKKFGAEKYLKKVKEFEKYKNKDGSWMSPGQKFFKQAEAYERSREEKEDEEIEYFNNIADEQNANFY